MSERADALARQYERAYDDFVQAVEACPEEKWKEPCADTGWPVNVQARHLAGGAAFFTDIFGKIARGEAVTHFPMAAVDQGNAQQLEAGRGATKAEVLAALREAKPPMVGFIRGLSDEQLDRRGQFINEIPAMTVEQMIAGIAMGELENHGGALRRAIGA
jgi:uncharacterized protein (TIGR03083 family)